MSLISGTQTYYTSITVVAASSGDGDTIAAKFNGIVFPGISPTAAVATNASGTVTILFASTAVRAGNQVVQGLVANVIAADLTLTSPITVSAATNSVKMAA
jgi:hypothetical protein